MPRHAPPYKKDHPSYGIWSGIIARCLNPSTPCYSRYGGRGISICEQWRDFWVFAADMGPRPPGMSIERIDNDGNYEPENCRWATQAEQTRNYARNIRVVVDGERLCLKDACAKLGYSYGGIVLRVSRGEDPQSAISRPTIPNRRDIDGLSLREHARRLGMPFTTLHHRLQKGWSVERALSTPVGGRLTREAGHASR